MGQKNICRVVVLNYNGIELLRKCLPSLIEALKRSKYKLKLAILDNGSQDGSRGFVQANYPGIEYTESPQNKVYASFNHYFSVIPEKYAIILNNDIMVEPLFADPLIDALEESDQTLFAAPQSRMMQSGDYEGSLSKMEMRWGMIWGSSRFRGHENHIDRQALSMQCGFGAFRRDAFLKLKGYDELYLPGTVEDTDLCFRGYRMGYKGVYCPNSVVKHIGQATFKKTFGLKRIQRMNERNRYLFVWKNIRALRFWCLHLLCMPIHWLKYVLTFQFHLFQGFFDAIALLPQCMESRKNSKNEPSTIKDQDIFKMSKEIGQCA